MIRHTMLAVALLATSTLVARAQQPASVAPQAQQHDTTKAKSNKSSHHGNKKKGATTAPAAPAAPKDTAKAK